MERKISIWKCVAGVLLLALGIYIVIGFYRMQPEQEKWQKEHMVPATGTVTGVENDYRNRAYCEYPVIRFTAQDGRDYTFTTRGVMCYSQGTFPVGRIVRVTYVRENPSQAYVDSASHDRATVIVIYAMGIVLGLAGAAFLYFGCRGAVVPARKM